MQNSTGNLVGNTVNIYKALSNMDTWKVRNSYSHECRLSLHLFLSSINYFIIVYLFIYPFFAGLRTSHMSLNMLGQPTDLALLLAPSQYFVVFSLRSFTTFVELKPKYFFLFMLSYMASFSRFLFCIYHYWALKVQ